MSDVWLVGKVLMVYGEEKGWMPEGVYATEAEAAEAAREDEFIAVAAVGERLPANAFDARKLYYPKRERWENSKMYAHQHRSGEGYAPD